MKIRKDDKVMVMTGKDRGRTGRVLKVDPRRGRVLVEGVNRVKRHEKVRPTQRGGQTGGITEKEAWVHASSVQLVNGDGDPTRAGYRVEEGGGKVRVCRKTGEEI